MGRDVEARQVPDGMRLSELWEILRREIPHFRAFASMPPAAVNREYAGPGEALSEGDEVAFLPPVAGG